MNQDFETLSEEMEQALGGLDGHQTQLKPGGDESRWNVQQTVGHLIMGYAATEDIFEKRIAKGNATRARPTLLQRFGQAVIAAGLFPPGRTAPEMVTPPADEPPVPSGVLIERVRIALKSLDMRMKAAEKLFGVEPRSVSHIVLGPLSIRQWRRFHLVHARHHIKFIRRIRREYGI